MTKKRLLILKTSSDICVTETNHIETIADLIHLEKEQLTITTVDDINQWASSSGNFDYIYLCGHANEDGFGEQDASIFITWNEFAFALCNASWLNVGGVLFLATCRGGLRRIADTMFNVCNKIDYICGPRWSATGQDLTTAFHIFIYNLEVRQEEPGVAVDRASAGTGRHFFCYDRLECYAPPTNNCLSFIQAAVGTGFLDPKELQGIVEETLQKKFIAEHSSLTSTELSSS